MTDLKLCPYCGQEPWEDQLGTWRCSNNVGSCQLARMTMGFTRKQWNKRFVCPDEDGKKVYAGDLFTFESFDVEDIDMPEDQCLGMFVWMEEGGRWAISIQEEKYDGIVWSNGDFKNLHITLIEEMT